MNDVKFVIHCVNDEEQKETLSKLQEMGYVWNSWDQPTSFVPEYKEVFFIIRDRISYSRPIDFREDERYDQCRDYVIEATEFCDQHSNRIILDTDVELLYE